MRGLRLDPAATRLVVARDTAIDVFGFDRQLMEDAAARIGPAITDIQQAPAA